MFYEEPKEFIYFIVIQTKYRGLIEDHVRGRSISVALERMIDQWDLAGQVIDFKWCIYRGDLI